jgi:GntR family transcriptional regulator / MocR family aminotransferase
MALMIGSGQYQRTVRRRRTQLSRRWETLRTALDRHLPWSYDVPPGGTSIWVTAPPDFDCVRLAVTALSRGVVVERGDIYFSRPEEHRNHLRLGFAALPEERIEPGVAILGELAAQQTAQQTARQPPG